MDILANRKLTGVNTHQRIHTSESRTIPMNFLMNVTWLSDSVCTHLTLEAFLLVSLYPFSRPIILMTYWVCRWKPYWIPTVDTQHILNNGNGLMMDKNVPFEDILQTRPCTTESSKLFAVQEQGRHLQAGATLGHSVITKIFVASCSRTRRANLEALGNPGCLSLLGNIWITIALPKTRVQSYSSKAASSLSRSSEIAILRRGNIMKTSPPDEMVLLRWCKAVFETFLQRLAVNIRKAHAEFRKASARKHDTSYQ